MLCCAYCRYTQYELSLRVLISYKDNDPGYLKIYYFIKHFLPGQVLNSTMYTTNLSFKQGMQQMRFILMKTP